MAKKKRARSTSKTVTRTTRVIERGVQPIVVYGGGSSGGGYVSSSTTRTKKDLRAYLPTIIGVAVLGVGAYLIYNWYSTNKCTVQGEVRCDGTKEQSCKPWLSESLGILLWQDTGYPCGTAAKAPGERSYPPYQNQMQTYNVGAAPRNYPPYQNEMETYNVGNQATVGGYAEDKFQNYIAFGQAPGISMATGTGERLKEGTRSY